MTFGGGAYTGIATGKATGIAPRSDELRTEHDLGIALNGAIGRYEVGALLALL